jgi:hypothetical protein
MDRQPGTREGLVLEIFSLYGTKCVLEKVGEGLSQVLRTEDTIIRIALLRINMDPKFHFPRSVEFFPVFC